VAIALCVPAGSFARQGTTAPSKKVTVLVVITDKGITVSLFAGVIYANGDNEENALMALPGRVPRGDYLSFNIFNRGKKVHDFEMFGKKTPAIKPGGHAHLFVSALRRGDFRYESTFDMSKAFRGLVTVY
jgi:hypothetical protein